jgi:hypothetical protein
VDAEEIEIDKIAYGEDVKLTNDADNSDGNYEDLNEEDYINKGKRNHLPKDLMEEDQKKCSPKDISVSVTGLNYSDSNDYINKVDIDSEDKLWSLS